jgi:hypothetical protein
MWFTLFIKELKYIIIDQKLAKRIECSRPSRQRPAALEW